MVIPMVPSPSADTSSPCRPSARCCMLPPAAADPVRDAGYRYRSLPCARPLKCGRPASAAEHASGRCVEEVEPVGVEPQVERHTLLRAGGGVEAGPERAAPGGGVPATPRL